MHIKSLSLAIGLILLAPLVVMAQNIPSSAMETLQAQMSPPESRPASLRIKQSFSSHDQLGDTALSKSATFFNRDLSFGLRNNSDVLNLQKFLIDQGFLNASSSGNYFTLTHGAVKKFQAAHNIKATGYFGPMTRGAVNKILYDPASLGSGTGSQKLIGSLSIDPQYVALKVGDRVQVKAIFTDPAPACLNAAPPCRVPIRVPYEVDARFTSNNPSVAGIEIVAVDCAVLEVNSSSCPPPLYFVRGMAPGNAMISASYTPYPHAYVARMDVAVMSTSTASQ